MIDINISFLFSHFENSSQFCDCILVFKHFLSQITCEKLVQSLGFLLFCLDEFLMLGLQLRCELLKCF